MKICNFVSPFTTVCVLQIFTPLNYVGAIQLYNNDANSPCFRTTSGYPRGGSPWSQTCAQPKHAEANAARFCNNMQTPALALLISIPGPEALGFHQRTIRTVLCLIMVDRARRREYS